MTFSVEANIAYGVLLDASSDASGLWERLISSAVQDLRRALSKCLPLGPLMKARNYAEFL